MFANKSTMVLFLIGSLGLVANVFADSTRPQDFRSTRIARSLSPTRHEAAFSSSSNSETQISQFISRWQGLSQSFSQCQSVFSQRSSITVATESVQKLYSSYQSAVSQYNYCASCAQFLSKSSYTTQIQTTVVQMYKSFQSIVATGQQYYGDAWQSNFASTFKNLSEFGSFSQAVCESAGIHLGALLRNVGLDLNLFSNTGIDLGIHLGGLIKRNQGGPVDGLTEQLLGDNSIGAHDLLGKLLTSN